MRFILLVVCLFLSLTNVYAAKIHSIIPVNEPMRITMNPGDTLVVDYDLTTKKGIYCAAGKGPFSINFVYKGNQKTAELPVVLQSTLPNKSDEMLADVNGQYIISLDAEAKNKAYEVSCHYIQ